MRGRLAVLFAIVATAGAVALGGGIRLVPSDYAPLPGARITLTVVGAPAGAEFDWDLNGDGVVDKTTSSPSLSYSPREGYQFIVVQVRSGGRAVGSAKLAISSSPDLGAFRTITRRETGALEVTITLKARVLLFAPGIEESIPAGWAAEIVDAGGAVYVLGSLLQAVWPVELMPGGEVSLKYLLHPAAGEQATLSGAASAYGPAGRLEVKIGGEVVAP